MTGLKDLLTDFRIIDGGYVAFAGDEKGGKITGQGTVCNRTLTLEKVDLVAELCYNLMKDLILLWTPRKNNTYVVDMNNPDIKSSMACLLSKASDSESLLWHRTLGVNFLASKDETTGVLKSLILKIEKICKRSVISIRSDNDTEFKNHVLNEFCERKGIYRQFSAARTPHQNGAKAVNTTNYVLNHALVVKAHNKTAYELFLGRKPLIEFFRAFGCSCTLLNTVENLAKFGAIRDECYIIEYSSSQKAYRVYNKRTKIVHGSYYVDWQEANTTNTGTGPDWFYDADIIFNNFIHPAPVVPEPSPSSEPSFIPSIQAEDEFMSFSTRITLATETAPVNSFWHASSGQTAPVNYIVVPLDQNLASDPAVVFDGDSDNNDGPVNILDENLSNLPDQIETPMFIDNEACVKIVKNLIYHSKTKHIDVRVHAIRDAYEKEYIQVLLLNTNDQKADIFTKAFDKSKFLDVVQKLGSKGGSGYTEGHVGQTFQQSFIGRGHPNAIRKGCVTSYVGMIPHDQQDEYFDLILDSADCHRFFRQLSLDQGIILPLNMDDNHLTGDNRYNMVISFHEPVLNEFSDVVIWLLHNKIAYAITWNEAVYKDLIEAFWINAEYKVHYVSKKPHVRSFVRGKEVLINESTVRNALHLEDDRRDPKIIDENEARNRFVQELG
ncbi:hypothetical protein L1987_20187 [Smallanthus sonchifolius]|uniref:Uncharacterized protein n=1 Tax=Smallanthus sonchifolius TaxID=185202 RepID=A0ACB9ISC6_9ASTR|nr:hypothetical protein L1987_20187 [Smallanthus sonchifolius]